MPVDVDAEDVIGRLPAHLDRDPRAAAGALDAVPLVPQAAHDLVERGRAAGGRPAGCGQGAGEGDPRVADQHEVEVGP